MTYQIHCKHGYWFNFRVILSKILLGQPLRKRNRNKRSDMPNKLKGIIKKIQWNGNGDCKIGEYKKGYLKLGVLNK